MSKLIFILSLALSSHANSDAFLSHQWGLQNTGQTELVAIDDLTSYSVHGKPGEDIGAMRAPLERNRDIIVAVLDTGVDYTHPDLDGQIVVKEKECANLVAYEKCETDECRAKYSSLDTDNNGYPMDCVGWNLTVNSKLKPGLWGDPDPRDDLGHGTHVAGILAAKANTIGVRGVGQNIKILPVKVLRSGPSTPVRPQSLSVPNPTDAPFQNAKTFGDMIAQGMLYAIRSGAQIINLSLGWPSPVDSPLVHEMIKLAQQKGILIVAAAGNDSTEQMISPCSYEGVICVASHDPDGRLSYFSNHGSSVDVAAPGLNILSLFPTTLTSTSFLKAKGYEIKSGTSQATPFVAGALARLLNAGLSPQEAYVRLIASARTSSGTHLPTDKFVQSGNADLANALEMQPQPVIRPVSKQAIRLVWDRAVQRLPIQIPLKNIWRQAKAVQIELSIVGRIKDEDKRIGLEKRQFAFSNWSSHDIKFLNTALLIQSSDWDGEPWIQLSINADGHNSKLRIALDVVTEVTPLLAGAKRFAIRSADLPRFDEIRSIEALDGMAKFDYLGVRRSQSNFLITLLKEDTGAYRASGEVEIAFERKAQLLLAQRFGEDYILIFKQSPSPEEKISPILFVYLDSDFLIQEKKIFSDKKAALTDRFQWMKQGHTRTPVWVARGYRPTLEKPKFDPWNPSPDDSPTQRIYYWASDGLRSVEVKKDTEPLALLPFAPNAEPRVLLAEGAGAKAKYYIGTIEQGKLISQIDLAVSQWREFRGSELQRVLGSNDFALLTPSFRGARRAQNYSAMSGAETSDVILTPLGIQGILAIPGVFNINGSKYVFAQTAFDLQLIDVNNDIKVSTSQKRFSFLPNFFATNSFFPVLAKSNKQAIPALWVAKGLGVLNSSLEVVVPKFDSSAQIQGVYRPAALRLISGKDCQGIDNPLENRAEQTTSAVYFCQNELVRVPLAIE